MSHYDTLGVERDASADDVKQAYRRKSSAAHPDKGGSNEQQAAVNRAYATLGDGQRRLEYDETGTDEPVTTKEGAAHELMLHLLTQALEQDERDVVSYCNLALDVMLQNATQGQASARRAIDKLTKRRGKIKVKAGENLAHQIIDRKLDKLRAEMLPWSDLLEIVPLVRALVENYDSSAEVEMVQPFMPAEFASLFLRHGGRFPSGGFA